jgi:hypothetical protein
VADVRVLQFPNVTLENFGGREIAPYERGSGRNKLAGGENRNLGSPLDSDVPHPASGEKRTRNERNILIEFSDHQGKTLPFMRSTILNIRYPT